MRLKSGYGCALVSRRALAGVIHGRRGLSHFRVIEHEVRTQHTRHWPRGTEIGHENALKLAVKQYIPLEQDSSTPGDVTFVAAHANGFPKVGTLWKSIGRHRCFRD